MVNTTRKSRVVLVTAPIAARRLEDLQRLYPDLTISQGPAQSTERMPDTLWHDVEILYTSYATPLPLPEQASHLRWVQLYSAGVDPVADHPLFHSLVTFTTTSGVHATVMAEYVFAVVLNWSHRLPTTLEWQQRCQWPTEEERSTVFEQSELGGRTVGIVGYGSIGRHVARLARAFGMRVLAMHRGVDHRDHGYCFPGTGDPDGVLPERYYGPHDLPELLRASDVVVITVPSTPQTRGLFDAAAFQAMKPSAFLVNVARGDICDERALVKALEERRIAGAALDVFHDEPLPPGSPLWRLPGTFITPHISSLTPLYCERATTIFTENLRRYLAGERFYNAVDKVGGY